MRYFMFSPVEMDEHRAFQLARPYLQSDYIIEVTSEDYWKDSIPKGKRPSARIGTYLVRVEADDSLYIVDRNLT